MRLASHSAGPANPTTATHRLPGRRRDRAWPSSTRPTPGLDRRPTCAGPRGQRLGPGKSARPRALGPTYPMATTLRCCTSTGDWLHHGARESHLCATLYRWHCFDGKEPNVSSRSRLGFYRRRAADPAQARDFWALFRAGLRAARTRLPAWPSRPWEEFRPVSPSACPMESSSTRPPSSTRADEGPGVLFFQRVPEPEDLSIKPGFHLRRSGGGRGGGGEERKRRAAKKCSNGGGGRQQSPGVSQMCWGPPSIGAARPEGNDSAWPDQARDPKLS